MTEILTRVRVHAIDPSRLAAMRSAGVDEHDNAFVPFGADGREPLRCCLVRADAGEQIALISYAPLQQTSPWTEVGPVFVHAEQCAGYLATAELPAQLRTGPRVLRSYTADGCLDYDHVAVIADGEDIADPLEQLLAAPGVFEVHVRALATQCFLFAVTSDR